ncbi:MAG: DUF5131 family protein [Desulfotomaculales bacterium]
MPCAFAGDRSLQGGGLLVLWEAAAMGDTKIPYVHKVWNFYTGCTPVSPGCANCVGRKTAGRLLYRRTWDEIPKV